MSEAAFAALVALGKVPSRGDFIRVGHGGAASSFDALLSQSMEWAESRGRARWPERFAGAPLQAFVYRAPEASGGGVIAGSLAPSQDRAGRRFPLGVFRPLTVGPALAAAPELLPLVLEDCWAETCALVLQSRAASSFELAENAAPVESATLADIAEARASYLAWVEELHPAELWVLLFGAAGAVSAGRVLSLVCEATLPSRGRERGTSPLSLRLPLGKAGGAAVCFWLDFVRRAAHWHAAVPTFFWSHDGQRGDLLLCLGDPPKSILSELWQPSGGRDEICDVALLLTQGDEAGVLARHAPSEATWSKAMRVAEVLELAASEGA